MINIIVFNFDTYLKIEKSVTDDYRAIAVRQFVFNKVLLVTCINLSKGWHLVNYFML